MNRPGKLWATLKQILPKSTNYQPNELSIDRETCAPIQIANCFNNCFARIGTNLASLFTDNRATDCLKYIVRRSNSFAFNYITTQDVGKQLRLLSTTKACGLDGIHATLLKEAAPIVAGPLTYMF